MARQQTGDPFLHWLPEQYQLLDFGAGRKLEKFGDVILDRLSPAADEFRKRAANEWDAADVVQNADGSFSFPTNRDLSLHEWHVGLGDIRFNVKLTPFGHVGIFPEQIVCWQWLRQQIECFSEHSQPEALNLFAYTGGSTLALAGAGARVVHVDASSPAVAWARRNAASSRMKELPIRWIVDDAAKFVARELRRGRLYDLIVMDPPSYGHGPTGKPWRIEEHLSDLLTNAVALLRPTPFSRLLITGHSELFGPNEIAELLESCSPILSTIATGRLGLCDRAHRVLDAGYFGQYRIDQLS